jgi:hypothetical protein
MNEQISTVGAGQDVFTRGHCGPDEAVLEQRVAGRFFDFSLTYPARSEGAVVTQRGRPRRSVTANQPAPCRGQPRSLPQEDPEQSGGGLTRALEGPAMRASRAASQSDRTPGYSHWMVVAHAWQS